MFSLPSFASGPEKSMIFLLVALQVQQQEILFGRVAALQCAFLFASLKKDEGLNSSFKDRVKTITTDVTITNLIEK